MTFDKAEVGRRIRAARNRVGLTQEQLSSKLGLTRQTIIQWERGKTTPDVYRLKELAAALGVWVWDLVPLTAPPQNYYKAAE